MSSSRDIGKTNRQNNTNKTQISKTTQTPPLKKGIDACAWCYPDQIRKPTFMINMDVSRKICDDCNTKYFIKGFFWLNDGISIPYYGACCAKCGTRRKPALITISSRESICVCSSCADYLENRENAALTVDSDSDSEMDDGELYGTKYEVTRRQIVKGGHLILR